MGLPGRQSALRQGWGQALDFAVPARVLADLNRLVEPTPPLVVPLGSMREPRYEVVLTIAMECAQATRSHEIPGGALHQITELYPTRKSPLLVNQQQFQLFAVPRWRGLDPVVYYRD